MFTLDGVIEAPGGNETAHPHRGWTSKYRAPETGKYKVDELAGVDKSRQHNITKRNG